MKSQAAFLLVAPSLHFLYFFLCPSVEPCLIFRGVAHLPRFEDGGQPIEPIPTPRIAATPSAYSLTRIKISSP
jgi:hypothetical protein